ncbi:MAG: glycosyltransferase, partial [Nitrospirota bacterium]
EQGDQVYIAFLNIHGNFDAGDRYWTAHPDFGGQLVYVKEVTLALGRMGHRVDIVTRRIHDPEWPGFEAEVDRYPGEPNVRIVRLACGGDGFRRKQDLWPYIATEWVPNIAAFYQRDGARPEVATAHYGDSGLAAALWYWQGGPPFTFTSHSLGAQRLERLLVHNHLDLPALDQEYFFARRIAAERVAMSHAARIITSTEQERREQYAHLAYAGAVDPTDTQRFAIIPPGVNLRLFDGDGTRLPGRAGACRARPAAGLHAAADPCHLHRPHPGQRNRPRRARARGLRRNGEASRRVRTAQRKDAKAPRREVNRCPRTPASGREDRTAKGRESCSPPWRLAANANMR